MARARSPNRDKAFELYKGSGGTKLLVDIATELGVSDSQIRKWKSQDKWDEQMNGNVTIPISNVTNIKPEVKATPVKEALEKLEDADLTEKQRLFCLYYVKSFNATMAAIKAGYAKESAHVEGSRLLRNVKVAAEIKRIKGSMQQEVFIDAMDVLNKYIKIAFADISDIVNFKPGYVTLKKPEEMDTSIISEIGNTETGIKVKLLDKMKALEKLEKYTQLMPDSLKHRLEEEKLKLEIARINAEQSEEVIEDDGLFEALEGKVSEVWDDAEES